MPNNEPRIRWAPKVRRHKINRLYQNDALGILDEELVAELGFDLFQRCRSILMVTSGDRVDCPACGAEIISAAGCWSRTNPIACPACGWKATYGQYRDSWRHQDLKGGNAVAFFTAFVEQYPRAQTPRERILLIDRLIHTFHWSARRQRSHVPVGMQLIEGGLEEVIAFLDRLTYGPEFYS